MKNMNPSKTSEKKPGEHHVTKKKIPLKFNYKLNNHILQPVDNSKYLGVTISNDLEWAHILII